ncbi:MAG TPA: hypothetical protein VI300_03275, partial [Solirubrobacter sp.]
MDPVGRELELRGRDAQARRRLHAAYTATPDASLAFELAAAAMTANDAPALRGWAATARRLAAGRGGTWAGDPALTPAPHPA